MFEFQHRVCLQCGVPKTYSAVKEGLVCPVCKDRQFSHNDADSKRRGSKIKDKERNKRVKGQSSHATWKSETEMHLRQQFDWWGQTAAGSRVLPPNVKAKRLYDIIKSNLILWEFQVNILLVCFPESSENLMRGCQKLQWICCLHFACLHSGGMSVGELCTNRKLDVIVSRYCHYVNIQWWK